MADEVDPKAEASAEKAYAAAAEAVSGKAEPAPTPVAPADEEPAAGKEATPSGKVESPAPQAAPDAVEFPPKAKREKKGAAKPAPAVDGADAKPAKTALPRNRKSGRKRSVAAAAKPAKRSSPKPRPEIKPAAAKAPVARTAPKISTAPQLKENSMEQTSEYVEGAKKAAADAQVKAKQAFDKGTALFGEYADFAKGNIEAIVESGKIFATGMQGMGSSMVAESKTAMENMTSDVKQLTSVKSPGDFIKLQTDILRRNLDTAMTLGTRNSQSMFKIVGDSFAPISARFSLAAEKLKKAA